MSDYKLTRGARERATWWRRNQSDRDLERELRSHMDLDTKQARWRWASERMIPNLVMLEWTTHVR